MPMETFQPCPIEGIVSSSAYFDEMRLVSKTVKPRIIQLTEEIGQHCPGLSDDFYYYYFKRIHSKKLLLRPFIFKEFLSIYGLDWEKHLDIAAIIEMINISTYQSNLAFDNKCGVTNQQSKSNQFISSVFSKLLVFNRIMELDQYTPEQKKMFVAIITKAYEKLYYGQYIDLNKLTFSNLAIIHSDSAFDDLYRKRCALIGGSLIEMIAELSSSIADKQEDCIKPLLLEFSSHFGLAGQVVNDLGDLSETGKSYTDRYFDLFNRRVTFPIREAILQTNSLEESVLLSYLKKEDHVSRIKNSTRLYIDGDVAIIGKDLSALAEIVNDIGHMIAIGDIVTKSRLIN